MQAAIVVLVVIAAGCAESGRTRSQMLLGGDHEPLESIDVLLPAPQPMALPHELGQLQRLRYRTGGQPHPSLRRRAVGCASGRQPAPRRYSLHHRPCDPQRRPGHQNRLRAGLRTKGCGGHRLLPGHDQRLHRQPNPGWAAQPAHSRRCLRSRLPASSRRHHPGRGQGGGDPGRRAAKSCPSSLSWCRRRTGCASGLRVRPSRNRYASASEVQP